MPRRSLLPLVLRYAIAVSAVAAVLLLELPLRERAGLRGEPFLFFFPAIALGAWVGGLGAGLLATVLAAATAPLLLADPVTILPALRDGRLPQLPAPTVGDVLRLALFALEGAVLGALVAALRSAREKAARGVRALAESEERLGAVAETAPVLIWIAGPDKRCRYVNRAWLAFTGRRLQEELGFGWAEGVHPEERRRTIELYERAFETGAPFRMEIRLRRHDGVYRWLLATALPRNAPDGALAGYVGSAIDISELKQADEERSGLLARERQLRQEADAERRRAAFLADVSAALAASTDYEATLASVARMAVPELADWCVVDLVDEEEGASFRRLAVAHAITSPVELAREHEREDDRERDRRFAVDLRSALGAFDTLVTGRPRLLADLPDVLLVEAARDPEHLAELRALGLTSLLCVPLLSRGSPIGAITLASTRPERRFGPPDLMLAEDIARRAALAVETARIFAAAQEANRSKDEFLATVSHELRTPLTAMLGWAQLLRRQPLDETTVARGLETIEQSARLQAQLVEDLLDVSRIVTGKLRLDIQLVELAPIIEAGVEVVRPAAFGKGIQLETALDAAVGPVTGDPARLQQVLWNVLSNAVKFTPRGGRIDVGLERAGSQARITVRDTGQGIGASFLPYVFDPFRQADSSSTRVFGGLGVGLAIVRNLVELHGGTIRAESAGEGRGATFTIELPLAARTTPVRPSLDRGEERLPSLAGVGVLVVEDHRDTRGYLTTVLEEGGASVRAVGSAVEAVAEVRRRPPDVLVSDLELPGEDGYELLRKVKALAAEAGTRIAAIALTGYAGDADRRRTLREGFGLHVTKPVAPSELVSAVAEAAGRTPASDASRGNGPPDVG